MNMKETSWVMLWMEEDLQIVLEYWGDKRKRVFAEDETEKEFVA